MSLSDREIQVLTTIIESYVATAAPVGSRAVSKRSNLGLSAASMRNAMSDLVEKGYLEQPHTSAGRIPTARAFRFYLDTVLQLPHLSKEQQGFIRMHLGDAGLELTDMLREAGRLISSMSMQMSMVLAPMHVDVRWKRVDFVHVRPDLVLLVLIFEGGIVEKRLVELEHPVTPDDLTEYANYLNDQFKDKTVAMVRARILSELQGAGRELSRRYSQALHMVREAFENLSDRELFVDGAVNMLSQPEFANQNDMRDLLRAVENRKRLLELLDKATNKGGILFSTGSDACLPGISDLGLVAAPYAIGNATGVVGVIGPIRMNYANVLPVVDYTARSISRIVRDRL